MQREYPPSPIVTVGLVVLKDDRALIIQRGHEPNKGRWSVPGGAVEVGESLKDAGRREVREECGIEVTVGDRHWIYEAIVRNGEQVRFHYIIIDFLAQYVSGELQPGDDTVAARWVTAAELGGYDMTESALSLLLEVLSATP